MPRTARQQRKPNMVATAAVVVAQETMTERELRQNIVSAARECGYLAYFTWTSIHSPRGMPDLILCRPPTLFAWELKSAKGKPTKAQSEWLDALKRVPGISARVVYPSDLEAAYMALVSGEWPTEALP